MNSWESIVNTERTKTIRFLMIGGFLGAGKTTTIGKLAGHYVSEGKYVALVTNDQAYGLVDTETLRAQGFVVGEVPGACFCCKFNDLIDAVSNISEDEVPDIVIAEPVGSCTDLVATVIEPMREIFGDRFELGPLVVLLKPNHGMRILKESGGRGFSPKAEYIFLKQLEEADAIAINKVDTLSDEEQAELQSLIEARFPGVPTFGLSARSGIGMDQLVEEAGKMPRPRQEMMDMDYVIYAEGEAELGWLNCEVKVTCDSKFNLDQLVVRFVEHVGKQLEEANLEVAHLKIMGQTLHDSAVANLVGSTVAVELSLASEINTSSADLLVNARVAAGPEQLQQIVCQANQELEKEFSVSMAIGNLQSFRPGKPEPTHRVGGIR